MVNRKGFAGLLSPGSHRFGTKNAKQFARKSNSLSRSTFGPDSLRSKADVVKSLQESFVYLHKGIATVNEHNLMEAVELPEGGRVPRELVQLCLCLNKDIARISG
jgi:hypothetical protein